MILREGFIPIALSAAAAAVAQVTVGLWASVPLLAVTAYLLRLFWQRQPPLPSDPNGVLSPVRGTVVSVGEDRDQWLDRDVVRVRIALRAPGVLPLRAPVEGKVMDLFTARGVLGEPQRQCLHGESPDCYVSWIRTDEGVDVVYAMSSRWPLSRARFRRSPGERVGHGKHCAFVYFASLVDVLMPSDSVVQVESGEEVMAGASIIARLR